MAAPLFFEKIRAQTNLFLRLSVYIGEIDFNAEDGR